VVSHHTLGKRTYELLLENILTGKYDPGQRLNYDVVTKDLGVSLTPLKEAFLRLEEQGLLVSIARRGTFVRKFSKTDIEELYQIREMMEGLSVRLACRKVEEKNLKELIKIHKKLATVIGKGELKNCVKLDIQFHETIANMSGNTRLIQLLRNSLFTNLFCISERGERFLEHGPEILSNHQKLISLLEKRDEEESEKVMREQIRQGGAWILSAMNGK
jgi:DNA-binding GntR family transcriptional regulator